MTTDDATLVSYEYWLLGHLYKQHILCNVEHSYFNTWVVYDYKKQITLHAEGRNEPANKVT